MKLICLQENLKKGLINVSNITGKNLTLPILNNILLNADKKQLKLSTTDLEMAIINQIQCKIEKEGNITIPAKLLVNFINNLPNNKIDISVKNNTISLKCENYNSSIKGLDAKDFPIIPKIKNEPIIEINSFEFKSALEKVVGFVSLSDIRPEISGVLFDFNNEKKTKLVATDSFRLGEKTLIIKNSKIKKDEIKSIIIPYKTVQELIKIISNTEESSLNISIENNQILFDLNEIQIISRLIEGNYPNYQQLIAKQFDTVVIINRDDLLKAVKIGSFFSSKINDVRLKINVKKSQIEVFSQDTELGENLSNIKGEIKGKDVEIIFNHKYLLDGLNNIDTEKVVISFNGETSPGIIKPESKDDFTYIIMPIKL